MSTCSDYEGHTDQLDEVLYYNERKGFQIRLTVSEFRGNYYLGIRKWIQDMEDEWRPTKDGFSWPYNLATTSTLFSALTGILSKAEVLSEVLENVDFNKEPRHD